MKRIFNLVLIFTCLITFGLKANAMTYQEAYAATSSKPMMVIIFANWADQYQECLNKFRAMQSSMSEIYNFAELDLASPDTKAFNQKFYVYPNLPYVMLIKKNGKVFRYIESDCVLNDSCFSSRAQAFIH